MDLRFPAATPRVSRSAALGPRDVVLIDGGQFVDGMRRLVVGPEISDDSIKALGDALREIDNRDGAVRWMSDLLTSHTDGSRDV